MAPVSSAAAIPPALKTTVAGLVRAAADSRQRRLLVLHGEARWCRQQAEALTPWLLQQLDCRAGDDGNAEAAQGRQPAALWVGEKAPPGIPSIAACHSRRLLGTETRLLIYNAFDGFNPDALAALSGTLIGGGLLLLLTPDLDSWHQYPDPDYRRMLVFPQTPETVDGHFLRLIAESIKADPDTCVVAQGQPLPPSLRQPVPPGSQRQGPQPTDADCLTADQQRAVAAVIKVVNGHRRRPLVLTADRGRGKSAALGIAAARLLKQAPRTILVTAPQAEAVTTVFEHARRLLPGCKETALNLSYSAEDLDSHLRFLPPDQLLRLNPAADLLLVDEAAAIPAPMLEALLQRYSRIAFATTVHGYEGTGRGFHIRFSQRLQRLAPGWQALKISQPIRWAENDPLERWVFAAMLLDAEVADERRIEQVSAQQCRLQQLQPAELLAERSSLRQLFALLVQAHYRTTPGDLRDLLDGSNLQHWVLRADGQIVASLLVAREGGFDRAMANAIWAGQRRPRGHLLPQVLCAQAGWLDSAELSYLRVVRIAVHPRLQNRGLGSLLLAKLIEIGHRLQVDALGSSFAATPELLHFWHQAGYRCLRLGLTRDASSGCHSALLARGLTERAKSLFSAAEQRHRQQFVALLGHTLTDLDGALVATLLRQFNAPLASPLQPQDELDLVAYLFAHRGYEQVHQPLQQLALRVLTDPGSALPAAERDLLIARVLQNRSWQNCAGTLGGDGKKQLQRRLRLSLREPFQRLELAPQTRELIAALLGD